MFANAERSSCAFHPSRLPATADHDPVPGRTCTASAWVDVPRTMMRFVVTLEPLEGEAFRGAPHDGRAVRLADGLTISALLRAVRRANRVLEERGDEIQDDVPEAVTQDDSPEVA